VIFVGVIIKLSGLPACVEDEHCTNPFVCLFVIVMRIVTEGLPPSRVCCF